MLKSSNDAVQTLITYDKGSMWWSMGLNDGFEYVGNGWCLNGDAVRINFPGYVALRCGLTGVDT